MDRLQLIEHLNVLAKAVDLETRHAEASVLDSMVGSLIRLSGGADYYTDQAEEQAKQKADLAANGEWTAEEQAADVAKPKAPQVSVSVKPAAPDASATPASKSPAPATTTSASPADATMTPSEPLAARQDGDDYLKSVKEEKGNDRAALMRQYYEWGIDNRQNRAAILKHAGERQTPEFVKGLSDYLVKVMPNSNVPNQPQDGYNPNLRDPKVAPSPGVPAQATVRPV